MPGPATATRISRWGIVVMASALVIGGAVAALAIASVASSHERVVSFDVRGSLNGVSLDVDDGDVMITGGGQRALLGVQRTDRYAFGHDAAVQRTVDGGELRLRSRCPNAVPARVLGQLPRGGARQRPGDRAHHGREGDASAPIADRRG